MVRGTRGATRARYTVSPAPSATTGMAICIMNVFNQDAAASRMRPDSLSMKLPSSSRISRRTRSRRNSEPRCACSSPALPGNAYCAVCSSTNTPHSPAACSNRPCYALPQSTESLQVVRARQFRREDGQPAVVHRYCDGDLHTVASWCLQRARLPPRAVLTFSALRI